MKILIAVMMLAMTAAGQITMQSNPTVENPPTFPHPEEAACGWSPWKLKAGRCVVTVTMQKAAPDGEPITCKQIGPHQMRCSFTPGASPKKQGK